MTMKENELNVSPYLQATRMVPTEALADAIDLASDQDRITYLTVRGKRIAAIVPVDVAEYGSKLTAEGPS
jgi:hypothetical protein